MTTDHSKIALACRKGQSKLYHRVCKLNEELKLLQKVRGKLFDTQMEHEKKVIKIRIIPPGVSGRKSKVKKPLLTLEEQKAIEFFASLNSEGRENLLKSMDSSC